MAENPKTPQERIQSLIDRHSHNSTVKEVVSTALDIIENIDAPELTREQAVSVCHRFMERFPDELDYDKINDILDNHYPQES